MVNPDPEQDQFILTDHETLDKIADAADLKPSDTVLEIGAGPGNLTGRLALHAGRVIAFEKDERFGPGLAHVAKNVEVHLEDASPFVAIHGKHLQKKPFNKVVSNLPYSLCEWLLHQLTHLDYDKAILLVPKSFADKINDNPVFGSFFDAVPLLPVHRSKFNPVPRTDSVLIDLRRLPDPLVTHDLGLFLRQYMYRHESQRPRNALAEGLVQYAAAHQKALTKNEARAVIASKNIAPELLELVLDRNWHIYAEVGNRFASADVLPT